MKRRMLSMLLAIVLCLSILPVNAMAEEETILAVEELISLAEEAVEEAEVLEETAEHEETEVPEEPEAPEETAAPEVTESPAAAEEEIPAAETEQESETLLASSGTYGTITWELSDDGVLTISGTGDMNKSWSSTKAIKRVVIGDGITSIRDRAFYDCANLTSITIGDGVTTIGDYAFAQCISLANISIPNSVTAIGNWAFESCTGLTTVTIGDSVTTIGIGAFSMCNSLTSVTIPVGVTTIGRAAFTYCKNLCTIEVSSDNKSFCSIDGVLFTKDATKLLCCPSGKDGAYTIPDSVSAIEEHAFSGCTSLTSITIPDGVTTIGDYAFGECTSLPSVTIPDSVTSIGQGAFSDCTGLTTVIIGDGLTTIDFGAFYYCEGLTSLTLSSSVTWIKENAFTECYNLRDIYYSGSEEQWKNIDIEDYNLPLTDATIHYNWMGDVEYLLPDVWSFANSTNSFGWSIMGYEITNEDYNRVTRNLLPTEAELIKSINEKIDSKWGGSCHGMSTWVCLVSYNTKKAIDIGNYNLLSLYDCTKQVESAINFYHLQQMLPVFKSARAEFISLSQITQLEILEKLASNAHVNGGVLIEFGWYDEFNSDGTVNIDASPSPKGHAVVGYGVESGDFTQTVRDYMSSHNRGDCLLGAEFTKRILIYDCSYPLGGDKYHLYYGDGAWCIPGWGIISTSSQTWDSKYNNGALYIATADSELINRIDYVTGEYIGSDSSTESIFDKYLFSSVNDYSIAWGDDVAEISGITVKESTSEEKIIIFADTNITTEGETTNTITTAVLPNAESYTISSETEMEFSLLSDGCLVSAIAEVPGTAKMDSSGVVSFELDETAKCYVDITNDSYCGNLPWYTLQVESGECLDFSVTLTENGLVMEGDNLEDITTTANIYSHVLENTKQEMADALCVR